MNPYFLSAVRELVKVDIQNTAGYKTAKTIAKHPNAKFPNPSEVAFSMKIEVNDSFVNDDNFHEVVDAYVDILNRIYEQLQKDFPTNAVSIFNKMVSSMSLKHSF